MSLQRISFALLLGSWACGDGAPARPGPLDVAADAGTQVADAGAELPLERPETVAVLSLATSAPVSIPDALRGDETLFLLETPSAVLLGGTAGLFSVDEGQVEPISTRPVAGLATGPDEVAVVAHRDGFSLYDGALRPAGLDAVVSEPALSLAGQGGALWIGTASRLVRWTAEQLEQWERSTGVARFWSASWGSNVTIFADGAGETWAFKPDGASWSELNLSRERPVTEAVAGVGGQIFARSEGELWVRVALEANRVAWRPLGLRPESTGPEAIIALGVDPEDGTAWVVSEGQICRVGADLRQVECGDRPAALTRVDQIYPSKNKVLWLRAGTELVRVSASEAEEVRFEDAIANFAALNCARCHAGTPRRADLPLETYEDWVGNIDRIIVNLEAETMPADGQPLRAGSVDLIKNWRAGGFLR